MSIRIALTPLIAGALVIGNVGLGVLAESVPSTSYFYSRLTIPADNGKEVQGLIVTPPSAGTFTAFEDGTFTLTGAPSGSYSFVYRLFVDGVDMGTASSSIVIGPVVGASVRIASSPLIAGAVVVGNTGLGVLGSTVPSGGLAGASYLYNDLTLPADNNVEIRGLIVTPPSAGTFFAFEDGSFTLIGAPHGTYSFLYRLFADGVDLGTATATINANGATASMSVAGVVTGAVSATATITVGSASAALVTGTVSATVTGVPVMWSAITNYSDLLVQLNRLIDGDETTASDIPTATLQQIVMLGERRVYREVRSRHNEKAFAGVTVSSNLAPIPADWEATSTMHFGKRALLPRPEDWIREYLQSSPGGDCLYFAEAGDSLYFGPSVADSTAVQGRYFYRHPDLSESTFAANTLMAAEPDVFIYAALSMSAPFFQQDARIAVWETEYVRIRDSINRAKNRAAYLTGRVVRTASTRVMR